MKTHTNYQIINDLQGMPAYVLVPYHEFQLKFEQPHLSLDDGVPAEVVDLSFDHNYSAARAWREYLGLTQSEVAARMGISQSAYSQHENAEQLTQTMRTKVAMALGIKAEQLDF